jgi:hypothetical protein
LVVFGGVWWSGENRCELSVMERVGHPHNILPGDYGFFNLKYGWIPYWGLEGVWEQYARSANASYCSVLGDVDGGALDCSCTGGNGSSSSSGIGSGMFNSLFVDGGPVQLFGNVALPSMYWFTPLLLFALSVWHSMATKRTTTRVDSLSLNGFGRAVVHMYFASLMTMFTYMSYELYRFIRETHMGLACNTEVVVESLEASKVWSACNTLCHHHTLLLDQRCNLIVQLCNSATLQLYSWLVLHITHRTGT